MALLAEPEGSIVRDVVAGGSCGAEEEGVTVCEVTRADDVGAVGLATCTCSTGFRPVVGCTMTVTSEGTTTTCVIVAGGTACVGMLTGCVTMYSTTIPGVKITSVSEKLAENHFQSSFVLGIHLPMARRKDEPDQRFTRCSLTE
ncbi:MAG TPA: hypothetical protein VFH06_04290 [Candidatus Saccharimonadales bacterium]|nr:hypothetical protein [Candidatus Saccharimonadales bacterium]